MSNIDKRALREAAEKATPGPWCIARNGKTITSNQSHPVAVITEDFHRMLANGKTGGDAEFISAANPVTVLALLDELEVATDACNGWQRKFAEADERLEAAEKRIAEPPGQKRLIGWRMADYTDETADPALAKNWATAVDVLPIFEGDVNTKLSPDAAGKGE